MSILLIFCVLAAAGWLVLSLVGRNTGDPGDSVAEYSRALNALAPDSGRPRHRSAARRGAARSHPARRSARPRPSRASAGARRPVRR